VALVGVEERVGDGGGEDVPVGISVVVDLVDGDGDVVPVEETALVVSHHWCVGIHGDGVAVSTEETAPVVGDNGGSDGRSLGQNGNDLRGLPRGTGLGEAALPPSVEVVEQLGQSVEDELGVEGTHGA
jgi:hypothetical protein